jgi:hypothetical protein
MNIAGAGGTAGMMRVSEKVEQAHIVQLARALGASVYVLGTRRRRGDYPGTMQTPGIPDLWIWWPARPAHYHPAMGLWWEVKAADGCRTDAQEQFAAECEAARVPYGCGTCDEFIRLLVSWGRVRPDQVNAERLARAGVQSR